MNASLQHDRALDGKPFRAMLPSDKVRPLRIGIVTSAESMATPVAAFFEHCHRTWAIKRFPCQAAPVPEK